MDDSKFNCKDKTFLKECLNQFSYEDTLKYFNSLGVTVKEESQGKIYPTTLQATTVVDALKLEIKHLNIDLLTSLQVISIKYKEKYFEILFNNNKKIRAKEVILACGGSAMPSTGSDGNGISLAKQLGVKYTKVFPSLVQIKSDDKLLKSLKGVRCNAKVTLCANNKKIKSEMGQVQFLSNGLSGICVMQLSRKVNELKNRNLELAIDLCQDMTHDSLKKYIKIQIKRLGLETANYLLIGILNKKLGEVILKKCNISPFLKLCSELTDNEIDKIVECLKELRFSITGTFSFKEAQVTAGGIDLSEISSATMQISKYRGLFVCGELIDIDGDCGGYNLQWAWTSGYIAGNSAARDIVERDTND